jgi:hypothetical protein
LKTEHIEVGVCGLSCRLCPAHHRETGSPCPGCKSTYRLAAACSFLSCGFKKKGLEFCGFCENSATCPKWLKHRETGKKIDSFVCYQKLENNIQFILQNGILKFEQQQQKKEDLLKQMLAGYDDGRSKTIYCIAATVMELEELNGILAEAEKKSAGSQLKEKAAVMRSILDRVAAQKNYLLKLRK